MHSFCNALVLGTLLSISSSIVQVQVVAAGTPRGRTGRALGRAAGRAAAIHGRRVNSNTYAKVLGGPDPYGWTNSSNVDDEANLAFDLGAMYEEEDVSKRKDIYENGYHTGQKVTLQSLGIEAQKFSSKDPLYNYYTYALREIGEYEDGSTENKGQFDNQPAEEYANTIVTDLFEIESDTSHVHGIEKEATLILGLWMRVHHYMQETVKLCRDGVVVDDGTGTGGSMDADASIDELLATLDKGIALWIGRLQVHGDNTRGTMLYNLAERAGANFVQDHGEVPVNRKLMEIWTSMKTSITDGICSSSQQDENGNRNGYKVLYEQVSKITTQMNIPLIQNFIHYITIGAETKIIELYAIAIFPQITSCDETFVNYFYDELRNLALKPENDVNLQRAISIVRGMYSCLGVSCDDIGAHVGGTRCVDDEVDPIAAIVGYTPKSDVRGLVKFDRDMSQIVILLLEGNVKSAFDLYKYGRNAVSKDDNTVLSLQSMARHEAYESISNDEKRLYTMYEEYNTGGSNFADVFVSDVFQSSEYAHYIIPILFQTIVAPQYALRAFFQAYDTCEEDSDAAESYWDQGVAALAGSIEGTSAQGNVDENGMSWFSLGDSFCDIFQCDDMDTTYGPMYRKKMMDNIEFGRSFIRSGRCAAVKKKIVSMESLLITPMLQATLFHTYERSIYGNDDDFAFVFAYGVSILPFLHVANKEDADIIQAAIYNKDTFTAEDAKRIWNAIIFTFNELGVDCTQMGKDIYGVIEMDTSFCNLSDKATQFPTTSPSPTTRNTSPRPSSAPSPIADLSQTEIHPSFRGFFSDIDSATEIASIALDVRDINALRGDIDSELKEAMSIYANGKHADIPLRKIAMHDQDFQSEDPMYNFYRDAFRGTMLFDDPENSTGSTVNTYVDALVTDALENANDIELASEVITAMGMFMKISHSLSSAVTKCQTDTGEAASAEIDSAFAYYIGVGQSPGSTDGHLFYSFTQRAASHHGTFTLTREALANDEIRRLFSEAKQLITSCSSTGYQPLRKKVGAIISMMNVPLVQHFYFLLKENAYATTESNYLELFGVAVLPQIKTCQPSNYLNLMKEITESGVKLDPAKTESLLDDFEKTYSCFGITCDQVHGANNEACQILHQSKTYAGFSTTVDVSQNAIMDRDLLKIVALMSEEAYGAALEYYENGHMIEYQQFTSLKNLAISQANNENPYYAQYENVNDLITNALQGTSPFNNMNSKDRVEAVFRTIQTMLFVQAGMSSIFISHKDDCAKSSLGNWDLAAAYFIGSIEGQALGGDPDQNGVSIYGLAKSMCTSFNVCTQSNNADSNKYLLAALSKGQDLISSKSCDELKDYIDRRIVPLVIVPLIQSTINFVYTNNHVAAYVMGLAISPFLQGLNAQTAVTIQSNTALDSSERDSVKVMEAFADVLSDLWVDCTDVGVSLDLNQDMCGFNSTKHELSYSLSDGLYVTTTFVKDSALIAKDVEFITAALRDDRIDSALSYYQNGLFSETYDSSGRKAGLRSIRKFSTEEASQMVWEPVFNLYRYTLQGLPAFKSNVNAYADIITMTFFGTNSFSSSGEKTLAAESAVALNIWGVIVHKLYETIHLCENNAFKSSSEGTHNIDEAVAYWIGSNQATGDEGKGHLLYRLTEEGGKLFKTESLDAQSRANRYILKLFKEAAMQLAFPGACYNGNSFVISQLRFITNKLVSQMTVPLIQHLIYNLKQNKKGRVHIYAHAVVPLLAACNKSTFEYLKDKLIVNQYSVSEVDDIIRAIQSTYSCLDLKCKDIGHRNGVPECNEREEMQSLAGYTTVTDVREYLDFDVDIRYIEIMLNMEALDAAREIYDHGKHVILSTEGRKEPVSLRSLATSVKRQIVPSFAKFETYFSSSSGSNYADGLIVNQFNNHGSFIGTQEQYTAIIVNTLQYQVMYMAILQNLYQAIADCESSNRAQIIQARTHWDTAAALITGSMQKSKANQNDGYLLYGLALDLCSDFNKCDGEEATINLKILDAMYSGSFLLEQRTCSAVEKIAGNVEKQLLVPLIQGTLKTAYTNSQFGDARQEETLASGYVYSRAILPFIHDVNPKAAQVINKNMDFQFGEVAVVDGYAKVFDEISNSVDKMGINCKDIGYMNDAKRGICNLKSTSGGNTWNVSILLSAVVIITSFTILLF